MAKQVICFLLFIVSAPKVVSGGELPGVNYEKYRAYSEFKTFYCEKFASRMSVASGRLRAHVCDLTSDVELTPNDRVVINYYKYARKVPLIDRFRIGRDADRIELFAVCKAEPVFASELVAKLARANLEKCGQARSRE